MKLSVEEFSHDHLNKEETTKEVEKFLSKELTKDFNEVIKKLQEAKSDPVGFGRSVRAFHPQLMEQRKMARYVFRTRDQCKSRGGNYANRHIELNFVKPASYYASRVSFSTEFLFLDMEQTECQRDCSDCQTNNEADPVTERT